MDGSNNMEAPIPFNGSGTFSRLFNWLNDFNNGINIDPTRMDSDTTDIANGLSDCVTRDGQSPATANLPMGGFKHTGVADAALQSQYASAGQVQNGSLIWGGTASGTNTITFNITPTPAAYATGQRFAFIIANTNSGAVTVNISSLGAKSLTKYGTSALVSGDIVAGQICVIQYDGTEFQLSSPANPATTISVADGAAATPSISFTSDPDTGIYRIGTNSIGVATNGTLWLSINSSGQVSLLGPGNPVKGTITNDAAATGYMGEYVESKSASATNFPTTGTFGDAGSISLTAGDWDVSFLIQTLANGATVTTIAIGISSTSGNSSSGLAAGENQTIVSPPTSTTDSGGSIPSFRVTLASTTTIYAKIFATFSVATPQYKYRISARRVR